HRAGEPGRGADTGIGPRPPGLRRAGRGRAGPCDPARCGPGGGASPARAPGPGSAGRPPARRRRRPPRPGGRPPRAAPHPGPATPAHTIYSKRVACSVPLADPTLPAAVLEALPPAIEVFARDYAAYFEANRHDQVMRPGDVASAASEPGPVPVLTDPYPRVVLLPGLGRFTSGKAARPAGIVADISRHTAWVLGAASGIGRYVSLTARDAFDVEFWPLELYKLQQAPPEKELARRVALVTGAAGGI